VHRSFHSPFHLTHVWEFLTPIARLLLNLQDTRLTSSFCDSRIHPDPEPRFVIRQLRNPFV
jgi:hypothetical protein